MGKDILAFFDQTSNWQYQNGQYKSISLTNFSQKITYKHEQLYQRFKKATKLINNQNTQLNETTAHLMSKEQIE